MTDTMVYLSCLLLLISQTICASLPVENPPPAINAARSLQSQAAPKKTFGIAARFLFRREEDTTVAETTTVEETTLETTTVSDETTEETTASGESADTTTVSEETAEETTVSGESADTTTVSEETAEETTVSSESVDTTTVLDEAVEETTASVETVEETTVAEETTKETTVAEETTEETTVADDSGSGVSAEETIASEEVTTLGESSEDVVSTTATSISNETSAGTTHVEAATAYSVEEQTSKSANSSAVQHTHEANTELHFHATYLVNVNIYAPTQSTQPSVQESNRQEDVTATMTTVSSATQGTANISADALVSSETQQTAQTSAEVPASSETPADASVLDTSTESSIQTGTSISTISEQITASSYVANASVPTAEPSEDVASTSADSVTSTTEVTSAPSDEPSTTEEGSGSGDTAESSEESSTEPTTTESSTTESTSSTAEPTTASILVTSPKSSMSRKIKKMGHKGAKQRGKAGTRMKAKHHWKKKKKKNKKKKLRPGAHDKRVKNRHTTVGAGEVSAVISSPTTTQTPSSGEPHLSQMSPVTSATATNGKLKTSEDIFRNQYSSRLNETNDKGKTSDSDGGQEDKINFPSRSKTTNDNGKIIETIVDEANAKRLPPDSHRGAQKKDNIIQWKAKSLEKSSIGEEKGTVKGPLLANNYPAVGLRNMNKIRNEGNGHYNYRRR